MDRPLARSVRRRFGIGVTLLMAAIFLVACGSGDDEADRFNIECPPEEMPCTLHDIESEILTRMLELGDEASELSQQADSTWLEVAEFLQDQPDVIDVTQTLSEIVFEVEGALPAVVLSELSGPSIDSDLFEPATDEDSDGVALDGLPGGGSSALGTSAQVRNVMSASTKVPTTPMPFYGTAGEPGAGNDREPMKKALILEPYGPMGNSPIGQDVAEALKEQEQYDLVSYYGDIDHWVDSFNVLKRLDEFDVVHISTHGSGGGISIHNARPWYVEDPKTGTYKIPEEASIPQGIGTSWGPDGKRRFYVHTEFFQKFYPGGLKNTLFYADWCGSSKGRGLPKAILGDGSIYAGWDESVPVEQAAQTARYFWEAALDWSLDSKAAYLYVIDRGAHYAPPLSLLDTAHGCLEDVLGDREGCPRRVEALFEVFTNKHPLHAIDTVTSFSADGQISAGTELEWTGEVDDGEEDELDEIRVKVVGLSPSTPPDGHLEITIDGEKIDQEIAVSEMEISDTDGQYWEEREITLTKVELPFDVTKAHTERELPWRVKVVAPGGNVTLHTVDGVRLKGEEPEIEAVHPIFFHKLSDGDNVEIDGVENDGEPDDTSLAIAVNGVGREVLLDYRVEVTVSGGTLNGERNFTWELTDFEDLENNQWRKMEPLPLDYDLTDENRPLTIDARIFDPEEEISQHSPTILLHADKESECFAEVTIAGHVMHEVQMSAASGLSERSYPVDLAGRFESPQGAWVADIDGYENTILRIRNDNWSTEHDGSDEFHFSSQTFGQTVPAGETGSFTLDSELVYYDWENVPWARTGSDVPRPSDGFGVPDSATVIMKGQAKIDVTKHVIDQHVLENWGETTVGQLAGTVSGAFSDDHGSSVNFEATFEYSSDC